MGHIRVDLPNTNNKWVEFGLAHIDSFIIRVGFELTNVDTICTLTRLMDTNCHPYMRQGAATFRSCLWWIWRWRNEFIFQNLFLPIEKKMLRLKKILKRGGCAQFFLSSICILDGRMVGDSLHPIHGWLSL